MKMRGSLIPVFFISLIVLSGCSHGGSEPPAPPPPPPATTLNGMVSKGPISGASVNVYAISSGVTDTTATIGRGQTVDGGSFSIDLGAYKGPVLLEVAGGSFTDEVSGATVGLKIPLHAVIGEAKAGDITTVAVTPLTELAYKKATGSGPLTVNSINEANASIALMFGLKDIISTLPVPNGETDGQKKYAAACGTFSQLINNNKGASETLDDALARLIGKMGGELENEGKLSTDSTVMINGAISSFNTGTANVTGTTIVTLPTPTAGLLHLATVGVPYAIDGIDVTIAMPLGVTVDYDPITGETAPGIVSISGVANFGNNNLVVAKYTPALLGTPALLHIVLVNTNGFGLGEFATIQFNVIPGGFFPLTNSFIPVNLIAKGITGASLAGVAAVPMFVEGM